MKYEVNVVYLTILVFELLKTKRACVVTNKLSILLSSFIVVPYFSM